MFGVLSSLCMMLIASVILTLLLRFTSLGESTLELSVLLLSFLALFTGGVIAGLKAKHKGIVVGAATSLLYCLIVASYRFLGLEAAFTVVEFVHYTAYLLLAIIGSIIGVNIAKPEGHK